MRACPSGGTAEAPLECQVDSAVTKTEVHWPTDVSLLWDAMRCLLRALGRTCQEHEVKGWRKYKDWTNKVKSVFNAVRTSARQRNKNQVEAYLELCSKLVARAVVSCEELWSLEASVSLISVISSGMIVRNAVLLNPEVKRRSVGGRWI